MPNFFKADFINNEMLTSTKARVFFAILALSIVVCSILAIKYYSTQDSFQDGISKRDFIAKKKIEVVDANRTELMRRDADKKVKPIMMPVEDNYIRDNLQSLTKNINEIKHSDASRSEKEHELEVILQIESQQNEQNLINFILNSSPEALNIFFQNTTAVLDELLKIGIPENDFWQGNTEKFISNAAPNLVKKTQIKPISNILEQVIVPNLIIDDKATEEARKVARSSVKPYVVTFEKGEQILKIGEPVTQFKKASLERAGYNLFELNKSGIFGMFLLVCLTVFPIYFYIKRYEKKFYNARYFAILSALIVLITACASLLMFNDGSLAYLIPIPAFCILVAIFTNSAVAFLSTILILNLFGLTLNFDIVLVAAFIFSILVATYFVSKINYSKRFDLIKCGLWVATTAFLTTMLIEAFKEQTFLFSNPEIYRHAAFLALNCFFSSIISLGILPIFENVFKIVTPYSLIELSDHNSPLLAKLQYKAPGTYHHSLMVANLCEAAAEAIGANPILARVGAFYHDIGKLKRPLFFIENQSYFGIENPHTKLNPRLSKMVITSHTKDGVELAKEYGLPDGIINFVQQHHGEGLAGHFYNQAVQQEGAENVDMEQFRYPGPKPDSKETAILMLADAVESAVRSLKSPTQEEIENMINKIITERLNDGQLSDSPLTLKDIKLIAVTFNRLLRGMQHDRIKYHQNILEIEDADDKIRLAPDKDELQQRRIAKKMEEHKVEKSASKDDEQNDDAAK